MKETLAAARWNDLAARIGIREPLGVFRWLQGRYGESKRKYHSARHINECLAALDRATHQEASNPYVEYALWFHDAIYSTYSKRNEERSADYAVRVLEQSGSAVASRELVRSLILATRHGEIPTSSPHQLLVDVDLAILGADADRYAEFELQIRAEYWWVPTLMYRRQRGVVLQSFVDRASIYSTHEFRERLERQARNNIAWGLDQLNAGMKTFSWNARF